MKVAIIYESKTGNTKLLADEIAKVCKEYGDIVYIGDVREDIPRADLYFVGSWTDKGSASDNIKRYLPTIKKSCVAYFGTAGFGGSREYYESIADNVLPLIDSSNYIVGKNFCQGRMPMSVRERYVAMLDKDKDNAKLKMMIDNFDDALSHPDEKDLSEVRDWAEKCCIDAQ